MVDQRIEMKKMLESKDFNSALNYSKEHQISLEDNIDDVRKPLDFLMKNLYTINGIDQEVKKAIKDFHNNGMSIEETSNSNYLHSAVANNDYEMTDWLLKSNKYSLEDRFIGLNLSFNENVDYKIFRKMLEVFPESVDYKKSLLFSMADYGYKGSENKMFLLMHTSNGINVKNEDDQNLLHKLAEKGNSIILKAALSSHEIDVNHVDKNGETALFKVSSNKEGDLLDKDSINKKMVLLIESGINVLTRNKDNKDAFEVNSAIKDLKPLAISMSIESKEALKEKVKIRKPSKKM